MIISIDGNVYTGKTSTILYAKKKLNVDIISEYNPIEDLGESSLFDEDIQCRYIDQEKERLKYINSLSQKNIFMDRSILSIVANSYAQFHLHGKDLRLYVISILKQRISQNKILIPDFFIHLKSSHSDLLNRYIIGEKGANAKGTCKSLVDKDYCKLIDEFHFRFQQNFTAGNFNSIEFTNPEKVLNEIKSSLPHASKVDGKQLLDIIQMAVY